MPIADSSSNRLPRRRFLQRGLLGAAALGGDWFALIEDGWKYAWSTGGAHQLFNLTEDPWELHNMFMRYPEHARTMADTLHEYLAELPQPGPQAPVPVGKEMQVRLKSLGYLK